MKVKKFTKKDRYGNMMSFEFDVDSELNVQQVPPMGMGIPRYKAVGGMESNHPGGPKGSDTVPAWLTPGEFVVNKEATDIYGPIIKQMNDHGRAIQNGQKPPAQYAKTGKVIEDKYQDNVRRIYTHLKNKWKLNNNQIGAILGQIGHETGGTFDYQMLEKNVDASVQGQGLFQNTPGKNRMLEPYLKYLKKNELTNSPESQIDFFMDSFMTKGAVPREDNPNTDANEASPWYHGSKKADRMRNALMNKDLRVNVGWKDKDPSLVGELTRFINVPGESLKSRDNWTKAGLQWANKHGMEVYPGLPKDKDAGNLYEAGATTSFPGEEKYENVVPMEKPVPTWKDRVMQIKNKFIDNLTWNEGGVIPPAYLEHGGWHWGDPSTWSWDHWNYDPAKNPNKNIPDYIGPPISTEQHDKMWGGRPDDNNNPLPESWKGYADHWEGATGEGSGYETEYIPIVNTPPNPNTKSDYQGRGDKYLRTGRESQTYIMPQKWNDRDRHEKARVDVEGKDYYYPGLKWTPGQIKVPKLDDPDFWRKQHSPEYFTVLSSSLNQIPKEYPIDPGVKGRLPFSEKGDLQTVFVERLKAAGTDPKKIAEVKEWHKKELAKIQAIKDQTAASLKWQKEIADYKEADKNKELDKSNQTIQESDLDKKTKKIFDENIKKEKEKIKKDKKEWLDDVNERAGENAKVEVEKESKAQNLINSADAKATTKVDESKHSASTITKAGEEGTDDNQKKTAMGMLRSFLGPLFDTQELKRMAVIYLGSRLLGYDHGGSIQYAAKSYLGRVDKKDAAIQKWVLENYGKVTPKSLQKFLVTRNPGDLRPIGAREVDTGETRVFLNQKGQQVVARKYTKKGSDGQTEVTWRMPQFNNNEVPDSWLEAGKPGSEYIENSTQYDNQVNTKAGYIGEQLEKINTALNQKTKAHDGAKATYHFNDFIPANDKWKIAEWAQKNRLKMTHLGGRMQAAFQAMLKDKGGDAPTAGTSILPYLEQELIKQNLQKTSSGKFFFEQDKLKTSRANMVSINADITKITGGKENNKVYQDLWNLYNKNKIKDESSKHHGKTYKKAYEAMNKDMVNITPFAQFVKDWADKKLRPTK